MKRSKTVVLVSMVAMTATMGACNSDPGAQIATSQTDEQKAAHRDQYTSLVADRHGLTKKEQLKFDDEVKIRQSPRVFEPKKQ